MTCVGGGTYCITGAGCNTCPGCSLTDLSAVGIGRWSCAGWSAGEAVVTGMVADFSVGCGPAGGAVETGLTCCITCGWGLRGCITGAGVKLNWVVSDATESGRSMSARFPCIDVGKFRKWSDWTECTIMQVYSCQIVMKNET